MGTSEDEEISAMSRVGLIGIIFDLPAAFVDSVQKSFYVQTWVFLTSLSDS